MLHPPAFFMHDRRLGGAAGPLPDDGERRAKRRSVAARRGPKEAWSQPATRRTGTGDEACPAGRERANDREVHSHQGPVWSTRQVCDTGDRSCLPTHPTGPSRNPPPRTRRRAPAKETAFSRRRNPPELGSGRTAPGEDATRPHSPPSTAPETRHPDALTTTVPVPSSGVSLPPFADHLHDFGTRHTEVDAVDVEWGGLG